MEIYVVIIQTVGTSGDVQAALRMEAQVVKAALPVAPSQFACSMAGL